MKSFNLIVSLIFAVLISGCSAMGEKYSGLINPDSNKGVIYFYRPWKFFQGGTAPTVYINDKEQFTLKNNGYGYALVNPGNNYIRVGKAHFLSNWAGGDLIGNIKVDAKQYHFLRLDLQGGDIIPGGNSFTITGNVGLKIIPMEQALKEMKDLNSTM